MDFSRELLPGAWAVTLSRFDDPRGSFVKTYSRSIFEAHGIHFDFREEFHSFSNENVVRGMHFQLPPHDHVKLVYCPQGAVLDVLLDLRRGCNYGRVESVVLDSERPMALVVPRGVAHGFKSLCDDSLMVYKTSTEHVPTHDCGIRWDSIDFDWNVKTPVVSARDTAHPVLSEFMSPFHHAG